MLRRTFISLLFLVCLAPLIGQGASRVVSLTPSITENIYEMNGQDKLIACTSFCTKGVKDGKTVVGSAVEINIERILSLKPDLILTMGLTKKQDIETLQQLGLEVMVIKTPVSFEELCEQTLMIGKLMGNENNAQALVDSATAFVTEIRNQTLAQNKIFFQIGADPIFTVLENTFMDDFITICDGENIAKGLKMGSMSREGVVLKDPDIVIIATMGGFGDIEKKTWEGYPQLSAVKNNKVFLIASETSCSPTPLNFISALNDVYGFVKQ